MVRSLAAVPLGNEIMQMKRGIWTFGLLAALVAGGCKTDQDAGKPRSVPVAASAAATPAAQPISTDARSNAVAAAPAAKPSADLPKAQSPDAPKVAKAADAKPITGFDPATAPQTARVKGWYQWRGPEQNGISREKNLPETWDPDTKENVVWVSDVGSMSSPVIWNGKLYTWTRIGEVPTGAADDPTLAPGPKTQEALTCVDISNGKVLWRRAQNMTQTEVPFHRLGWSSPCVDPSTGRVYALGSQCWFLCLDGNTGDTVWQRQM